MNAQTNFQIPDFMPALPEIFLLSMTCIILIVDLYLTDKTRVFTYLLSLGTLAVTAALTVTMHTAEPVYTFSGSFVSDSMGDVLKIFVYLVTAVVFVYSRPYLEARGLFKGEFFTLGLFGVLGMMVLISAHNLLTIYLGLELLSLSMYAMVALHRDSVSLASGMLLYGMSLLYGVTGTLDITAVHQQVAGLTAGGESIVLGLGLVLVIVGMAFKLGAVPFHMWVPDVYHGAPTAVTLYIGAAPKIAAFAMVMRLLVEGLGDLHAQWQDILIIMAVLSMAVGNIIAIAQTNIKRMLAYSTISQSRAGFEADNLDDFKGLSDRSPWFALMMLILMFSMAGVPPTLGFYAKLSVLQAVVGADLTWLAVTAVVFSIIGAFYYLRIIKLMYFDKAEDNSPLESTTDMKVVLSANALAILALGFFPSGLLALCAAALG
jgi:NADH-quinone oxidoreductase subunit N